MAWLGFFSFFLTSFTPFISFFSREIKKKITPWPRMRIPSFPTVPICCCIVPIRRERGWPSRTNICRVFFVKERKKSLVVFGNSPPFSRVRNYTMLRRVISTAFVSSAGQEKRIETEKDNGDRLSAWWMAREGCTVYKGVWNVFRCFRSRRKEEWIGEQQA